MSGPFFVCLKRRCVIADYEAQPRVTEAGTIRLFGNSYKLAPEEDGDAGKVRVFLSTVYPPKYVIGDYGEDDQPTLSTYTVTDLRGGGGLRRYRNTRQQLNRFHKSTGVNTLWAGEIAHGFDLSVVTNGPLGKTFNAIFGYGNVIYYVVGSSVRYFNDVSHTTVGDMSGSATGKPFVFRTGTKNRAIIPSNNGYSYFDSVGGAITDVNPGWAMVSGVAWDSKVYALSSVFGFYVSTTAEAESWQQLASVPHDASVAGQPALLVYDDASGEPVIWCITNRGPFVYDAVNDKWFAQRYRQTAFTHTGQFKGELTAVVYRGSIYMLAGRQRITKLTMAGGVLEIEDVSLDLPDGPVVSGTKEARIRDMEADDHLLYLLLDFNDVTVNLGRLMAYNGQGWHTLMTADASSTNDKFHVDSLGLGIAGSMPYLTFGWHFDSGEGVGQSQIGFVRLNNIDRPPSHWSLPVSYLPEVDLPEFDGDDPFGQKLALWYKVRVATIAGQPNATIQYRLNGSDEAYTSLGAITSTGETTLYFGTDNVGVPFKSIQMQWRPTWFSGVTPRFQSGTLGFVRLPDTLRGFTVRVDCSNDFEGRTPQQQVDDLFAAIGANTLGTFAWRDDEGNTRSYLVKPTQPQGMEDTGYVEGGVYTVALISYRDN